MRVMHQPGRRLRPGQSHERSLLPTQVPFPFLNGPFPRASRREAVRVAQGEAPGMRSKRGNPPRRGGKNPGNEQERRSCNRLAAPRCHHFPAITKWYPWLVRDSCGDSMPNQPSFRLLARSFAAAALLCGLFAAARPLAAQQPYKILDRWKIGGDGGWDYLLVDSPAHRLYLTRGARVDRKSTRLNSSHLVISYAVFCL